MSLLRLSWTLTKDVRALILQSLCDGWRCCDDRRSVRRQQSGIQYMVITTELRRNCDGFPTIKNDQKIINFTLKHFNYSSSTTIAKKKYDFFFENI